MIKMVINPFFANTIGQSKIIKDLYYPARSPDPAPAPMPDPARHGIWQELYMDITVWNRFNLKIAHEMRLILSIKSVKKEGKVWYSPNITIIF